MSEPLFDLYFSGQCIANAPLEAVKKNLATVFKADAARIETLFNGQTHCIKKGLDEAGAQKYQAVLRKAGAIIEIRPQQAAAPKKTMAERLASVDTDTPVTPKPAASKPAATQTSVASSNSPAAEGGLTLSRPGEPLLRPEESASQTTPANISVPEFETLGEYTRLSEEPPPPPPAPDTSALSTAESYERLSEESPPPPPAPDTDFLSIAEVGSRIGPEMEAFEKLELPELDNLDLSPPGADLLTESERKKPAPAQVPDTSHLSINKG